MKACKMGVKLYYVIASMRCVRTSQEVTKQGSCVNVHLTKQFKRKRVVSGSHIIIVNVSCLNGVTKLH